MRLVKFTLKDTGFPADRPTYIAHGAVTRVQPYFGVFWESEESEEAHEKATEDGTQIWVAGDIYPTHVKEDIEFVMNALYYSNDGGHTFGSTNERKPS